MQRYESTGEVHTAEVGPGPAPATYIWLAAEAWPDTKEVGAWRRYRTVHQAVRCAIQVTVHYFWSLTLPSSDFV